MTSARLAVVWLGCMLLACGGNTTSDNTVAELAAGGVHEGESTPSPVSTSSVPQPRPTQSALPPGVDLRSPEATRTILARTAVILEGTVSATRNTYDERLGPRTIARIQVIQVLAGASPGDTIELAQFGGPLPDGRGVSSSNGVLLSEGSSYLLFLTNGVWYNQPWVATPLRIETVGAHEVLVDPQDRVVVGLDPGGLRYGADFSAVTEAVRSAAAMPVVPSLGGPQVALTALSKPDFHNILEEAMAGEQIRPSGSFDRAPRDRGAAWHKRPTAAPPVP